jgi:cephalosporin hydroxylase
MTESHNEYLNSVDGEQDFVAKRSRWQNGMSQDTELYISALNFLSKASSHNFVYQWSWLGVPIIKLPEDILVIQEFIFEEKPEFIVEIGVARGGGIKLYSSLQRLCSMPTKVVGIDIKFFPHTLTALKDELESGVILIEGDSISRDVLIEVELLLKNASKTLLILDGNHSHKQVLQELNLYGDLLSEGSTILVADTIAHEINISEKKREWNQSNNPKTALDQFLRERKDWTLDLKWSRRALISESRDGWIKKDSSKSMFPNQ